MREDNMGKLVLRKSDIMKMLSISESTLKRKVKSGDLPKPFKVGKNTSANLWRANDLQRFFDSKANQTTNP